MDSIKKLEKKERERLFAELAKTKPGTKEYDNLQKQLGAYAIMAEKDSAGKIKSQNVFGAVVTICTTAIVVFADQVIPRVGDKLRTAEFIHRNSK